MKHILISALLLASAPAFAGTDDDYVACLVGWSAVSLLNGETNDAEAAQAVAYQKCPRPELPEGIDLDGLEDMVNFTVEAIAKSGDL